MKPVIAVCFFICLCGSANCQTYHSLQNGNFQQNWTDTNLITVNHNWSNVPAIMGFRGDNLTLATGVDPQTVLADQTTVNVIANQTSPDFLSSGGVAEFHLANPAVALQGSGTADAPFIVLYMKTTGVNGVRVKYKLRDLDGSANNAVQAVALQYRTGTTGNFINIPAGYIADATTGPSVATLVTNVNVLLPPDCNNVPQLQIRIITCNANGSDEWVGIDDLEVLAESQIPLPVTLTQFTSSRNANGILVSWQTATELHNKGFDIQTSADGVHFSSIEFVQTKAFEGNSDAPLNYLYTITADNHIYYLRLKQVDQDGNTMFSKIISTGAEMNGHPDLIRVFPMPVRDQLHMIIHVQRGGIGTILFRNAAGQLMKQQRIGLSSGDQEIIADMSGLTKGIWFLQMIYEGKQPSHTVTVLKE